MSFNAFKARYPGIGDADIFRLLEDCWLDLRGRHIRRIPTHEFLQTKGVPRYLEFDDTDPELEPYREGNPVIAEAVEGLDRIEAYHQRQIDAYVRRHPDAVGGAFIFDDDRLVENGGGDDD
jgi:hypothetical protein